MTHFQPISALLIFLIQFKYTTYVLGLYTFFPNPVNAFHAARYEGAGATEKSSLLSFNRCFA